MNLSDDDLYQIALHLPLEDLLNMCRSDEHLDNLICNRPGFWRYRFGLALGNKPNNLTWLEYYRQVFRAWMIVGDNYLYGPTPKYITLPYEEEVMDVVMSRNATIMVSQMGGVWAMGQNACGMFSSGLDNVLHTPVRVDDTSNIVARQVALSDCSLYLLDVNNMLWSRGGNVHNELGRPTATVTDTLERVVGLGNVGVAMIQCGPDYAVAIDVNGDAWGAGGNIGSGLPFGPTYTNMPRFQRLNLLFRVAKLSCGRNHIMFIDIHGNLWGMGDNRKGQLGFTGTGTFVAPQRLIQRAAMVEISCRGDHSVVLDAQGNAWISGDITDGDGFTRVFQGARKVSCGENSTTVIDLNNNLWGSGNIYSRAGNRIVHRQHMTKMDMKASDVVSGDGSFAFLNTV